MTPISRVDARARLIAAAQDDLGRRAARARNKKPQLPVLMRSGSSDWRTPVWLAEALKKRYGPFDLDPAAAAGTSLGRRSFDRHDGGLTSHWRGAVYCNPPHNRSAGETVGPWIQKAIDELGEKHCTRVVMLVPSRTDTVWFHELVLARASRVIFVRGRLKFHGDGTSAPAPFPSMVIVFGQRAPAGGPAFSTITPPPAKTTAAAPRRAAARSVTDGQP